MLAGDFGVQYPCPVCGEWTDMLCMPCWYEEIRDWTARRSPPPIRAWKDTRSPKDVWQSHQPWPPWSSTDAPSLATVLSPPTRQTVEGHVVAPEQLSISTSRRRSSRRSKSSSQQMKMRLR